MYIDYYVVSRSPYMVRIVTLCPFTTAFIEFPPRIIQRLFSGSITYSKVLQ